MITEDHTAANTESLEMNTLGMHLCQEKKFSEAIDCLQFAHNRLVQRRDVLQQQRGQRQHEYEAAGSYGGYRSRRRLRDLDAQDEDKDVTLRALEATTLNNLGVVLCHHGDYAAALRHLDTARLLESQQHESMGSASYAQKRYEGLSVDDGAEAERRHIELLMAATAVPASPTTYLNLCAVYNALKAYDRSAVCAMRALDSLCWWWDQVQHQRQLGRETNTWVPMSWHVQVARDTKLLWGAAWHNLGMAILNSHKLKDAAASPYEAFHTNRVSPEVSDVKNAHSMATYKIFRNALRATTELLGSSHPMTMAVHDTYRYVRGTLREMGAFRLHQAQCPGLPKLVQGDVPKITAPSFLYLSEHVPGSAADGGNTPDLGSALVTRGGSSDHSWIPEAAPASDEILSEASRYAHMPAFPPAVANMSQADMEIVDMASSSSPFVSWRAQGPGLPLGSTGRGATSEFVYRLQSRGSHGVNSSRTARTMSRSRQIGAVQLYRKRHQLTSGGSAVAGPYPPPHSARTPFAVRADSRHDQSRYQRNLESASLQQRPQVLPPLPPIGSAQQQPGQHQHQNGSRGVTPQSNTHSDHGNSQSQLISRSDLVFTDMFADIISPPRGKPVRPASPNEPVPAFYYPQHLNQHMHPADNDVGRVKGDGVRPAYESNHNDYGMQTLDDLLVNRPNQHTVIGTDAFPVPPMPPNMSLPTYHATPATAATAPVAIAL